MPAVPWRWPWKTCPHSFCSFNRRDDFDESAYRGGYLPCAPPGLKYKATPVDGSNEPGIGSNGGACTLSATNSSTKSHIPTKKSLRSADASRRIKYCISSTWATSGACVRMTDRSLSITCWKYLTLAYTLPWIITGTYLLRIALPGAEPKSWAPRHCEAGI